MATASQNARTLDSPPPAGGGNPPGQVPSGAPTVGVGGGTLGQPPNGQDAPIAAGQTPSVVSSQDNIDAIELSPNQKYRIGGEVVEFNEITGALTRVPELQNIVSQYQQELNHVNGLTQQLSASADEWKYWYELASKNDFTREYLLALDNGRSEDEAIAAALRVVPGGKLPPSYPAGTPSGAPSTAEFVPPPGSQPGDPEYIAAKLEFMEKDNRSFRTEVMDILRRVPEEAAARLAPRVDNIANRFAQEDQHAQAEQAFVQNAEYNQMLVDETVGETLYTELGLDLSMLPPNEVAAINRMADEEISRYGINPQTIGQGTLNRAVADAVAMKVLNRYQGLQKPAPARLPINPGLGSNPVPGQGASQRGRFGPNQNTPSARARALERR